MTGATLRQALAYARCGWPVFPCLPGQKIPATAHGFRDATLDEQQITEWFGRGQAWNLAIATGTPGPDVLDVDQHGDAGNGYLAFATLERAGLLDGAAAYVRTPAGGMHAYFTGSDQHNGRLPSHHLDFRSQGGYILAPPSQVDGSPYRLIKKLDGHGTLNWAEVTRLLEPQRHQQHGHLAGPRTGRSTSSPAGSPAGPKATATPACTGPPTAPWTPTPPPISARWPLPPARLASTTRKSPGRSTPRARQARPVTTKPKR
jgi:hypothetical protein